MAKWDTEFAPFTVWYVDSLTQSRTRIKTYESLKAAESKAARVFRSIDGKDFGAAVHITDGRGETISSQEVQ